MENITIPAVCGCLVFTAFYIYRDIRNARQQAQSSVAPVTMLPEDLPIDSDKACETLADVTNATLQVAGQAAADPEAFHGTIQGVGQVVGHIVSGMLHHH
jgi:hypothetical protein